MPSQRWLCSYCDMDWFEDLARKCPKCSSEDIKHVNKLESETKVSSEE